MPNAFGFGAVGDGQADDTEALQHALDSGQNLLTLAKGTYRLTRPLVVDLTQHGYAAVRGAGGAARLVMAGAGPALRIVGDHRGTAEPSSYRPQTWDKERLPTVTGLEIIGAHPEAVGIELRKTTKCVLSQVLVRRCRYGVHLVERNRDFILADSHLYDNLEFGLFFDRCNLHQIIVHGCHISWNKQAGIKALGGDVHNLQIVGNDIEYNNATAGGQQPAAELLAKHPGGAEIDFDAREGVISEVTISGNTIQATVQPGGANIRLHGAEVPRPQPADVAPATKADTLHLVNITGNVLGSQWRAVEMRYASRITLTGNTIYDSADLSLFAAHSSGVVVSGNAFAWKGRDSEPPKDGIRLEDCDNVLLSSLSAQRFSAGSPERGAAITLVRCRECSVSDCQLLDPLYRGVELEDCVRCRICNNTLVDRRETAAMRQAIRTLGVCRQNLIAGNLLGGASDQPLVSDPAHGEVRDNLLT